MPNDAPRTPPAPTAETPPECTISYPPPAITGLYSTPPREEPPSAVLRALELARHDLTALHGLVATDQPHAYGDALREGLDANAARECQQEVEFTIDNTETLAALDAVLPRTAGIVSLATPGAGEGASEDTALLMGLLDPLYNIPVQLHNGMPYARLDVLHRLLDLTQKHLDAARRSPEAR